MQQAQLAPAGCTKASSQTGSMTNACQRSRLIAVQSWYSACNITDMPMHCSEHSGNALVCGLHWQCIDGTRRAVVRSRTTVVPKHHKLHETAMIMVPTRVLSQTLLHCAHVCRTQATTQGCTMYSLPAHSVRILMLGTWLGQYEIAREHSRSACTCAAPGLEAAKLCTSSTQCTVPHNVVVQAPSPGRFSTARLMHLTPY